MSQIKEQDKNTKKRLVRKKYAWQRVQSSDHKEITRFGRRMEKFKENFNKEIESIKK